MAYCVRYDMCWQVHCDVTVHILQSDLHGQQVQAHRCIAALRLCTPEVYLTNTWMMSDRVLGEVPHAARAFSFRLSLDVCRRMN